MVRHSLINSIFDSALKKKNAVLLFWMFRKYSALFIHLLCRLFSTYIAAALKRIDGGRDLAGREPMTARLSGHLLVPNRWLVPPFSNGHSYRRLSDGSFVPHPLSALQSAAFQPAGRHFGFVARA